MKIEAGGDKEAHRLGVQREQLPYFASFQGWRTVVFDDGFASAVVQAKLPRLQALMEQVRHGEIDIVLCIELSGLARDDSAAPVCSSPTTSRRSPGPCLSVE